MNRHNKLCDMVTSMLKAMPSRGLTVKIRTGWEDKVTTTKLIPYLQKAGKGRLSALMVKTINKLSGRRC